MMHETSWHGSGRSCLEYRAASCLRQSRRRLPDLVRLVDSSSCSRTQGRNTFGDIDRIAHTIVGASRAPSFGADRIEHDVYGERSAVAGSDRSARRRRRLGYRSSQITAAMSTFMGSSYVNDFDFNNRSYRVYVQADQMFRRNCGRPATGFMCGRIRTR